MLKFGFSREVITPVRGVGLAGYFNARPNRGVLDDLFVRAMLIEQDGAVAGLVVYDLCFLPVEAVEAIRAAVSAAGFAFADRVIYSAIHTHTGPQFSEFFGLPYDHSYVEVLKEKTVSAIRRALANLAPGQVSMRFGAKGPIGCAVTACASGNSAIAEAFRTIACGYADAMITGGTEAAVAPLAVAGFGAMRTLSTRNDEPRRASRPFDRDRDGFVIGEGCGVIILEEMEWALKRGARIYAELAGTGSTSDAFHMAAPPPGHDGAARCMRIALQDAGMEPSEIDYINAHGTSTALNDVYETEAIRTVFGTYSRDVAISSTKSMTGHMLGAAGGAEAIFSVKAIQEGVVPPTINLDNPDPQCDLDYTPHQAQRREIRAAMSNTFGFGGVNSVLIFKKFED